MTHAKTAQLERDTTGQCGQSKSPSQAQVPGSTGASKVGGTPLAPESEFTQSEFTEPSPSLTCVEAGIIIVSFLLEDALGLRVESQP